MLLRTSTLIHDFRTVLATQFQDSCGGCFLKLKGFQVREQILCPDPKSLGIDMDAEDEQEGRDEQSNQNRASAS